MAEDGPSPLGVRIEEDEDTALFVPVAARIVVVAVVVDVVADGVAAVVLLMMLM